MSKGSEKQIEWQEEQSIGDWAIESFVQWIERAKFNVLNFQKTNVRFVQRFCRATAKTISKTDSARFAVILHLCLQPLLDLGRFGTTCLPILDSMFVKSATYIADVLFWCFDIHFGVRQWLLDSICETCGTSWRYWVRLGLAMVSQKVLNGPQKQEHCLAGGQGTRMESHWIQDSSKC